jgi:hypothetical protein
MTKGRAIAACLALLCAGPLPALAAVLYEEVGNGNDLPIDPPYPLLALEAGTNSVLGRTSFDSDAVDSFAVSVPDGLQLTSITYVFTSSAFIRGDHELTTAVSGLSLVSGDGSAPQPGSFLAGENVDMIPGLCSVLVTPCGPDSESAVSVPLFEDAFPLESGIYSVEQRALTVNDPEFINWNSRYRVDLVVAPEPSALLLGGGALASLVALSPSKKPCRRSSSRGGSRRRRRPIHR